jgi:uncharacterized protein (DUF983 family)
MKLGFKILCPKCEESELSVRNLHNGQEIEICKCGYPENEEGFIYIEQKAGN